MKERRRYTLDNAEDFFAFNYSIKELLSEIYKEELQTCVYNAFYQVMMPQYGADPAECYEARFYSYGLFGFLDEWIKRGFYETPEQITELFRKMMERRGYEKFLSRAKTIGYELSTTAAAELSEYWEQLDPGRTQGQDPGMGGMSLG